MTGTVAARLSAQPFFAILTEAERAALAEDGTLAAVAYLAWMATLLGYGLWTYLMSRYPTNRVAPFTLLVPLVGLSTGWLVFGEALQPVHFAGGALLMAGLLLNLFGARLLARKAALAVP